MIQAKSEAIADVWNSVREWPASQRWSLASLLLNSLNPMNDDLPSKAMPADLIGVWKVPHPPDDDAVKRILDEERIRKFGS